MKARKARKKIKTLKKKTVNLKASKARKKRKTHWKQTHKGKQAVRNVST